MKREKIKQIAEFWINHSEESYEKSKSIDWKKVAASKIADEIYVHITLEKRNPVYPPQQSSAQDFDEYARETIENALYATNHFLPDQCTELADGILGYLRDVGFKIVKCN